PGSTSESCPIRATRLSSMTPSPKTSFGPSAPRRTRWRAPSRRTARGSPSGTLLRAAVTAWPPGTWAATVPQHPGRRQSHPAARGQPLPLLPVLGQDLPQRHPRELQRDRHQLLPEPDQEAEGDPGAAGGDALPLGSARAPAADPRRVGQSGDCGHFQGLRRLLLPDVRGRREVLDNHRQPLCGGASRLRHRRGRPGDQERPRSAFHGRAQPAEGPRSCLAPVRPPLPAAPVRPVVHRSGLPLDQPQPHPAGKLRECQCSLNHVLGWFARPLFIDGEYPACMRERLGPRLPSFSPEEREQVRQTADFFALSYGAVLSFHLINDSLKFGQHEDLDLRKLLYWVSAEYNNPPIFVVQSGWYVLGKTKTEDPKHMYYLKRFIAEALKSIVIDGVKVIGYTAWSLIDGFEWHREYGIRRGLYYIDFNTPDMKRSPR
ncbi:unnamed protein product, partial [Tetraodon nigroviridis]